MYKFENEELMSRAGLTKISKNLSMPVSSKLIRKELEKKRGGDFFSLFPLPVYPCPFLSLPI